MKNIRGLVTILAGILILVLPTETAITILGIYFIVTGLLQMSRNNPQAK